MLKEERSLLRPKDERLGVESLRVVVCFNFSNHVYDEATLAKRLRIHRANRPLNLAQIQFLELLQNAFGAAKALAVERKKRIFGVEERDQRQPTGWVVEERVVLSHVNFA